MAADTRSRTINVRDSYHGLTPKMQAVVDAIATNPDAGHNEIARIASDDLDGDSVSRSYVPEIIKKQGHLIDQRREQIVNRRFQGEERTTGDPFEGLLDGSDTGPQLIQDRAVQDTPRDKDTGESDTSGEEPTALTAELTRTDVEALLSGEVPEELKRELLARVVEQAFHSSD